MGAKHWGVWDEGRDIVSSRALLGHITQCHSGCLFLPQVWSGPGSEARMWPKVPR